MIGSSAQIGRYMPSKAVNISKRPIVNKYREGKMKSTPTRGVKQTLKPDAYKQREPQGDLVPFV